MKYSEQRYKMQIALNKIKTYSPTASKFYNWQESLFDARALGGGRG